MTEPDPALVSRLAVELLQAFAKDAHAHQITELTGYLPQLAALGLSDREYDALTDAVYAAYARAVITIPED